MTAEPKRETRPPLTPSDPQGQDSAQVEEPASQGNKPAGQGEGSGGEAPSDGVPPEVLNRRICDFDLRIEGRPLGRVVERFQRELAERGLVRLRPAFYLSDEWGVADGTVAIGMPFYLADEQLRRVHQAKGGMVEGEDEEDILRYLRHEMGHVVNYGYRLYERDDWTATFGPMSRPYTDQYHSVPFSPDFVRHLPGNYAQKHPDDDWAETFALWLTPGFDWRSHYGDAAVALAKLDYCDRVMAEIRDREPSVTLSVIDVEACNMHKTVQEFYDEVEIQGVTLPLSLDGDLRGLFVPHAAATGQGEADRLGSAAALIRLHENELSGSVYRWTAVDQGLVYALLDHLAHRAEELHLSYPLSQRENVLIQLSGFLTTLAMNYVYKGGFIAK